MGLLCYLKGTLMFTIYNVYTLRMLISFYKGVNANFWKIMIRLFEKRQLYLF